MLRFHRGYFFITLSLLIVETIIAIFIHDHFIRPYAGDFLVVILIYCFVRSFWNVPVLKLAIGVLLFSYAVEVSQYLKLISHLGLQHSRLAVIILGKSFQWLDLIAYTLGILLVLWIEKMLSEKRQISIHHS